MACSRLSRFGLGSESLAVTSGALWVSNGDRLLRLSLHSDRITTSVVLQGAASSDLCSNATGTVLIVGEANAQGVGIIERRNPVTGSLLASTQGQMAGVSTPRIGGVVDGGFWVSEATGMMGYAERLDLNTMSGSGCSARNDGCISGSNGITTEVTNGLLWVTQTGGGPTRNFCANPITGDPLASLPLPPNSEDEVLAVGTHMLYLDTTPNVGPVRTILIEEPIPAACHGS